MTLAPNPNNGTFGLHISDKTEQELSIQIIGSDGKSKSNQLIQTPARTTIEHIHLKDYATGIYTLIVQYKDGITYQKLVVNRNENKHIIVYTSKYENHGFKTQ
jgi:hypothetical protein